MQAQGATGGRRDEQAWLAIEVLVRRWFGEPGWQAFGDRFAFDVDLLIARAVPRIVGSGKAAAGIACSSCTFEDESVAAGRKASKEGIWHRCPRCGEDSLFRFYIVNVRRGDIARALFPPTNHVREAER
jgi:hypothetical protein